MRKKYISEKKLQSIVRKVLLEEMSWEDILKLGSDIAKKSANDAEKNSSKPTNDNKKSEPPKSSTSSTKSLYDKNKDELNKDLPEFTISASKSKNKNNYDALLIGGLDTRRGDYSIGQQVNLLKSSFGQTKKIKGVRYNTSASEVKKIIDENPGLYVFMFSAGCNLASDVAINKNTNKNKVFIIEPYAVSKKTSSVVKSAVSSGVPKKNVYVGPNQYRGLGIVSGASSTKDGLSHWQALSDIGNRI
jgi:hypothetical protein